MVIMVRTFKFTLTIVALAAVSVLQAQDARQIAQERREAEADVPRLVEELELKPGMVVADVGAGGGAMTIVLGKWIGPSGRVFATDISERTLATIRDYVKREALTNVTVLEGAAGSTNLPDACCDAIFMRDVYHHITEPEAFSQSLVAALKPGGRLAVIDFLPRPGSQQFPGVNPNRGGHGVPPAIVVSEVSAAGLAHVQTVDHWPEDKSSLFLVLFRKP
jgi:ubiquinone/menaquinone biosynthesis C-methylase UbiE